MRVATAVILASFVLVACHKKDETKTESAGPKTEDVAAERQAPSPQIPGTLVGYDGQRSPEPSAQPGSGAEAEEAEPAVKIVAGATYEIIDGADITVMNQASVSDGTWRYPAGSSCTAATGATVTIVGRNDDGILVKYHRAPVRMAEHAIPAADPTSEDSETVYECPDETVYFIDGADGLGSHEEASGRYESARQLLQSEHAIKNKR